MCGEGKWNGRSVLDWIPSLLVVAVAVRAASYSRGHVALESTERTDVWVKKWLMLSRCPQPELHNIPELELCSGHASGHVQSEPWRFPTQERPLPCGQMS